jgi:hypothetical protein
MSGRDVNWFRPEEIISLAIEYKQVSLGRLAGDLGMAV